MSFSHTDIKHCLAQIMNFSPDLHNLVNTMLPIIDSNKGSLIPSTYVYDYVVTMINLHDRLGHASVSKLKRIKGINISDSFITCYLVCPLVK